MAKNKLPTVSIKGKEYVLVKDRILAFNELYPGGEITTELLTHPDSPKIVVKATVTISGVSGRIRAFTGHSQATVGQGYINETAALENAETSAVGRALAFLGIGIIDSVASADELNKAKGSKSSRKEIKPVNTDIPPFGPGSNEED